MATGVRPLSGWVSDRMGDRRKPWIIGGYGASTVARAMLAVGFELGWQARARTIKLALVASGVVVLVVAALAVAFSAHRLAGGGIRSR